MIYKPGKRTLFCMWLQNILAIIVLLLILALILTFFRTGLVSYVKYMILIVTTYLIIDSLIMIPLNWNNQRVIIGNEEVVIETGILLRKKYILPNEKISLTKITIGPLEYMLNLSSLSFITLAGNVYTPALEQDDIKDIQKIVISKLTQGR